MQLLHFFLNTFVFIFGICIGSFLNCVIYRLEEKRSIKGRSVCPICKHQLSWRDLFPVLSFLFLGRKCRYCRKSISWQYPIVELTTGALFLLIFYISSEPFVLRLGLDNFQQTSSSVLNFLNIAFLFYLSSVLIIIFFYDLNYYEIPDKVLLPGIAASFLYRSFEFINWDLFGIWKLGAENFTFFLSYIFAAVVASGFFLAVFWSSSGRWMGFGDVKLAVLMGFLLGFPNILAALFLAFVLGAAVGAVLLVFRKKGLKGEIPFGPFLVTGTFVVLFWGKEIIGWYLSFTV